MSRSRDLSKLTDEGVLRVPVYDNTNKPPEENGLMGLNTSENALEIYNPGLGRRQLIGVTNRDGSSASRAFDTLDGINNLYTSGSGVANLWTTLNGELTTPILVQVNFDSSDGNAYIGISFDFSASNYGDADVGDSVVNGGYNNEDMSGGGASNGSNVGSFKWNSSTDGGLINVGFGDEYGFEVFGKSSWDGNYYSSQTYELKGWESISYINPATGLNFTSAEMAALRNVITKISPSTPILVAHGDSDGDAPTATQYNGSVTLQPGHNIYIRDADNNTFLMVHRGASPSNAGYIAAYTDSTFTYDITDTGSVTGSLPNPSGLPNAGMILPTDFQVSLNTGGGVIYGWYYNATVSPKVNNKVVGLIGF
jgi:hypothetical protein